MPHHGFLRVAAGCPEIRVADPAFNADRTLDLLKRADAQGVNLVVFPEMGLTGYTCHDLYHTLPLQHAAVAALGRVVEAAATVFAGSPSSACRSRSTASCSTAPRCSPAAGCSASSEGVPAELQGVLRRPILQPGRQRRVAGGAARRPDRPVRHRPAVPCDTLPDFVLGVEVCEDLWVPVPPSSLQALAGATVLANLSASNEAIGKSGYRRQLVGCQSGRCLAGYIYAASGVGESTTDIVFGGHGLIAENGTIVAEAQRFQRESHLLATDLDLDRLRHDRIQTNSFNDSRRDFTPARPFRRVPFALEVPSRSPACCGRWTPTRSCRKTRPRSRTAATRSSTPRRPGWRSGSATSATRRCRSACPAASTPPSPCSSCARRWTPSARRATG